MVTYEMKEPYTCTHKQHSGESQAQMHVVSSVLHG